MALFNNGKLQGVQAELAEFQQAFAAADARLDAYGPLLAEQFDGTVTKHESGRNIANTVVDDIWAVQVVNTPGNAHAVFTALVHDIPPMPVHFAAGRGADLSAFDLEEIEDWVSAARTGQRVNYDRHDQRASALANLLG